MSARATGWSGTRTATVGRPAVTIAGTAFFFGRTIVSGPGQKRFASALASGGTPGTSLRSIDRSATWTMSGLSSGRPFASKTLLTAAGSRAFAPRP